MTTFSYRSEFTEFVVATVVPTFPVLLFGKIRHVEQEYRLSVPMLISP